MAQPTARLRRGRGRGQHWRDAGRFGLAELAVAITLAAGGLSGPGALAAVLGYRIVNFWLVILTGWVIMLLLGGRPGASAGREAVTASRIRNR